MYFNWFNKIVEFFQIYNVFLLACSFHLMISSCISLTGIILAATWQDSQRCEAYFIMLYMRAAFWLITYVSVLSSKYLTANNTNIPKQLPALWSLCPEPPRETPSRWLSRFPSVHLATQGHPAADRIVVEYVPASDPNADSALLRGQFCRKVRGGRLPVADRLHYDVQLAGDVGVLLRSWFLYW